MDKFDVVAAIIIKNDKYFIAQRNRNKHMGLSWEFPGGKVEKGETFEIALQREIKEEIGDTSDIVKSIPLETFVSNDEKFNFHTYLCVVKNEFIPKLNGEHNGYAWVTFENWPKPLHQGLRNTLQNKQNLIKLQTVFQLVSLMEK